MKKKLVEKESPAGYAPKKTGKAYKVFRVKNGKLYPPMVANAGGAATPIGVWLDAEEGEFAGLSKTGRPQVKSTGSGNLAYRPGWHLGDVPRASQFDRKNKETGEMEFPKDFVWAECDYAMDIDYQPEADEQGHMRTKVDDQGNVTTYRSDKYQHSLAGLPKLPKDGYYKYRTNPRPDTVPWVITGQMRVNRLLSDAEVNEILKKNGIAPIHRQGGDKTLAELGLKESLTTKVNEAVADSHKIKLTKDTKNMVEEGDKLVDGSNEYIVTMVWEGPRSMSITVRDAKDWRPIYDSSISSWYGTTLIKGPFIRRDGELIKESLLKEDTELWSSHAVEDYYGYQGTIEDLKSELDDLGVDYDDWDDDEIRGYFLEDEFLMDQSYDDFVDILLPKVGKQCYDNVLVLVGDYARWNGTYGVVEPLGDFKELTNYIYPDYPTQTEISLDNTGVYYTQSSHDTPMGGTKIYLYSLKSAEDVEKLGKFFETDGYFDWDYDYPSTYLVQSADNNQIKELINKDILTPIKELSY